MYAIVRTGGKQYRVEEGRSLDVELLPAKEGASVELDNVLLIADNGKVTVGTPIIEGARVMADVELHGRQKKIVVFKYKSKVRTRKKTGHRQHFTRLAVTEILRPGHARVPRKPRLLKHPLRKLALLPQLQKKRRLLPRRRRRSGARTSPLPLRHLRLLALPPSQSGRASQRSPRRLLRNPLLLTQAVQKLMFLLPKRKRSPRASARRGALRRRPARTRSRPWLIRKVEEAHETAAIVGAAVSA